MIPPTKKLAALAPLALIAGLAACGNDDNGCNGPTCVGTVPPGAAEITQDIATSRTLFRDTTYTLKGFIHVTNGATLTIQDGTKILGDFDTPGSSLFVLRGAKIQAIGTADRPIVFTSSRSAGQRQPGDWGGLIIVGAAKINRTGTIDVEGTGGETGSGKNYTVTYSGGQDDADNSGELRYVRVEFAGFAPSLNNELNAFTFAAVGSGTKLSYLEALAGLDDSFEWFGGTADARYLVSYEADDDNFDMSTGFSGRLQNIIAFASTQLTQRPAIGQPASDPQGIENDGCDASQAGCTNGFNSTPLTIPVVANFTLVGTNNSATSGASGGVGMMLRRGTGGYYVNGIVARYPRAGISLRDEDTYVRSGSTATPDLATADLAVKNVLFVETPTIFQAASGSTVQHSWDLATNNLVASSATTASLLTAFPATVNAATPTSAFDWTPAAASAALSGGLQTFTGKLAAKAGGVVTGTSYLGAAEPGGAKWWSGWTLYAQN